MSRRVVVNNDYQRQAERAHAARATVHGWLCDHPQDPQVNVWLDLLDTLTDLEIDLRLRAEAAL